MRWLDLCSVVASALVMLLAATAAHAHPGVGIVQDSRGNVFFTDLKQVWKVTPEGKKSVAVPGVHTHELCLDADDNLYGEHLWYEGDSTKKWGHRVWRLKRNGTLSDVIPAREGFLQDYSFVRDRAGNMYWADRGAKTVVKKRSPDGKISIHAQADFRGVRWMTAAPDGTLLLIDNGDLRRVSPEGKVTTVVTKLSSHDPAPVNVRSRHYHMGLWTDGKGNVYVAVAEERLVLRVQATPPAPPWQGGENREVVARCPSGWAPSGGMVDRDGNLWLLEYSTALFKPMDVRVRRIDRDGKERVY
jgi:sugar lactone lactonase YvrE